MTKRVLVIDDNDGVCLSIQIALEAFAGWTVWSAACGKDGIAIALLQQPDLILLDVVMPEEDGMTVYQKLQKNESTKAIPTILLTGQALDRQEIMKLGIDGIITKPFQVKSLIATINQTLHW